MMTPDNDTAGEKKRAAGINKAAAKQLALRAVVDTQEELQRRWNTPTHVRVGPTKVALVCLFVTPTADGKDFLWNASARLKHHVKSKLKSVALWTADERRRISTLLYQVMDGVGLYDPSALDYAADFQTSTWALHLERPLTGVEKGIALAPRMLGEPQVYQGPLGKGGPDVLMTSAFDEAGKAVEVEDGEA